MPPKQGPMSPKQAKKRANQGESSKTGLGVSGNDRTGRSTPRSHLRTTGTHPRMRLQTTVRTMFENTFPRARVHERTLARASRIMRGRARPPETHASGHGLRGCGRASRDLRCSRSYLHGSGGGRRCRSGGSLPGWPVGCGGRSGPESEASPSTRLGGFSVAAPRTRAESSLEPRPEALCGVLRHCGRPDASGGR